MNGRLQRVWGVARLVMALGLAWKYGWAWALLPLGLNVVVLALGFVQLPWVNRGEDRPRAVQLLRAWIGEAFASELAFSWRQPWREWAEPDHLPTTARAGVLLVHGFACNRGRWNGWMRRLRAMGIAFIAPTMEPALGSIDAYADQIEAGVRRLQVLTGGLPVICAHSMGGLAVRAWWRRYGAGYEVAPHVITLGTPHAGTRMAKFAPGALNAAQMRLGSPWLAELPGLPEAECLWTPCDQIVNPAGTARMAGARALRVDGVGHMGLMHSATAWAALERALAMSAVSAAPVAAPITASTQALTDSSLSTPRRI